MRSATKGLWRIVALIQVVALCRHDSKTDAMLVSGVILLALGAYIGWSE